VSADLLIENLAEVATPLGSRPAAGSAQGRVERLRGAEVLCRDGRIAFVGAPEARRQGFGELPDAARLDGRGGTLIPGFVDPHTHLPWAGSREEEFIERLAGKSYQDHLPNITGVATTGDYGRLVDMLKQTLPNAHRVGTLFVPSEINSVFNKEQVEKEAAKRGLTLVSVPVETSGDVANAAQALVSKELDAVLQIPGNLTASAFASIAQAANRARLPLFSYVSKDARMGSVVTVSRDYEQAGRDAVDLVLRIMRGEDPAKIPFQLVSRSIVTVNLAAAARLSLVIPEPVRREAAELIRE